ncbi:NAD(P)/FAD-dependent oxidoreductase [Niveispirillum sp. SYP-B3756]|uniref:flavin monoamine oxidase family protein n=1 Tax=Niveispirillum sp. SYP-B3756 TaxID=2662178 RepID=UPI001566E455|nr:NAD(P)/FAD-dependent oxidoreductase [Niveispirillum sp. SYP-B3756]
MTSKFASPLLSRRAVVRGLVAAAPLVVASRGWAAGPSEVDVVVVGGGLSGLNAASILEGQGLTVQVVEASDRVGGRLRTLRTEGYQAEVGASEVGLLYGRVRDACGRLNVGLTTDGLKGTDFMINVDGSTVLPSEWTKSPVNKTRGREREFPPFILQNRLMFDWLPFKQTNAWLQPENMVYDISAAELMRSKGVSEAAIRLADIDLNGASLESVSSLSIFRDMARAQIEGFKDPNKPQYGGPTSAADRAYIMGGSDMLPKAMAAALKTPVRLNSPVVAVDQTDDKVKVLLSNGDVLTSRFLVMAAPFSAVSRIRFTPGLPDNQADAIAGARYSATTQFHFTIKKPFWEKDGLPPSIWSNSAFERAFAMRNAKTGVIDSLIVWVNGDGATRWDDRDTNKQVELVLGDLARLRPSIAGALEYKFGYSWGRNPFVGGNKHYFAPGQVKRFAADMGKPAGRIHFAGEHLRRLEHGMESAMETGEAAAMEILEKI